MRGIVVVVVALFIDGMQAMLGIAIEAVFLAAPGTIVGGAAGCAVGSAIASSLGCEILGVLGSIGGLAADLLAHPATAAIGLPLGTAISAVIDFCISATFGTGFIFLLIFLGLMEWRELLSFRRMPLMLGKLVPFFNILPFYTALAVVCIIKRTKTHPGSRALALARRGGEALQRVQSVRAEHRDRAQREIAGPQTDEYVSA